MSSDRAVHLRRTLGDLALYALIVGVWTFKLRDAQLGSTLEVALVGAVLGAVLGGLRTGADLILAAEPWIARRAVVGDPPRDVLYRRVLDSLVGPSSAGLFGAVVASVWALMVDEGLWAVWLAHGVLLAVFLASAGIGAVWGRVLRADRLAICVGAMCWAPILTAFAWVPAVMPHSSEVLGHALNANPMMGVLSALGRHDVFWSPLFYGRVPYAEYAVHIRSAGIHLVAWLAAGTGLALVHAWRLRRRWLA